MSREYPKEIMDKSANSKVTYKVVTVANPAAGANFSQTVPANKIWEIQTIHFHLVTSATVASRYPSITIDDGTTMFGEITVNQVVPENATREFTFAMYIQQVGNFFNRMSAPLPLLVLNAGARITSSVGSLLAGDQISAIAIYVKEISIA